jgi:hypothetical protein
MKRCSTSLFLTTPSLLLLTILTARAEFVPWDYTWVRTTPVVTADRGSLGAIALQNAPAGHGDGTATIAVTGLQGFSFADDRRPDVFTQQHWGLTLLLRDEASGELGSLTFTGQLNGTLTASRANVATTFTDPVQAIRLGRNLYTLSLRFTPSLRTTGITNLGTIDATVTVPGFTPPPPPLPPPTPPPTAPPPTQPPSFGSTEPSTVLLFTGGMLALGIRALRRKSRSGFIPS